MRTWLRDNSGVIAFLLLQATVAVVWGARLEGRVYTIEQRGSPQTDALDHRLTVVETLLTQNSGALARIEADVKGHLLKSDKVSPY